MFSGGNKNLIQNKRKNKKAFLKFDWSKSLLQRAEGVVKEIYKSETKIKFRETKELAKSLKMQ